ncbi:hypothetical protein ACFLR8_03720 [Bacteroidota bacterium]
MKVDEKRDIKRKLNVINFAKQIGNVKKACRYYGFRHLKDAARIDHIIDTGVKYLIINDPLILKKEFLQPYLDQRIGEYRNVSIFRLEKIHEPDLSQGEI